MNNNDALYNTSLDLTYLVSCSVNETKPGLSRVNAMNLQNIFRLAERHSLTAAAAFAIGQVMPLPDYFLEEKSKAVRKLALYEIESKRVFDALERNRIWYLPLKGSVLKHCYPKTAMREMTDVDILCDSSRMDDVLKIMKELGFTCKQFGKGVHDLYFKAPVMEFEMHKRLFSDYRQPVFSEYYQNIKDRLVQDAQASYRFRLSNEDLYIYLMCHIYKHYRYSGTGLRSLLDIYVFNKKYGGTLNRDYLTAELTKLRLLSFEAEITQLAKAVYSGKPVSETEKKEFMFFTESGCHGNNANFTAQSLHNDDSGQSKRKYYLRRLFPGEAELKTANPFVYRHRFLYPALIVYRPVKGLIVHPKKLLKEYRRIKNFKSTENKGRYNE